MDTQEQMMMKMIKMENNYNNNHMNMDILSDPFSSSLPVGSSEVDQKSSLGLMELLGFQDFYSSPSSIFENTTTYDHHQLPPPSSSSLSMDHHNLPLNQQDEDQDLTVDEGGEESLSSVVLNVQSPNSCSISSPANQQLHKPLKQ